MELRGKKILVVGLGRTGRECARFLAQRGANVLVSDLRGESELAQEMTSLAGLPIEYRLGGEANRLARRRRLRRSKSRRAPGKSAAAASDGAAHSCS